MVFLENDFKIWKNKEILELLELCNEKQVNLNSAKATSDKIDLVEKNIAQRKKKCNKILGANDFMSSSISINSGNVLIEEGVAIRSLEKEEKTLNEKYDDCLKQEEKIDRTMNLMADKIEIRERKNNIKQKFLKSFKLFNEDVKSERIEDKIKEKEEIKGQIRAIIFESQKLNDMLQRKQIDKQEFSKRYLELRNMANICNERKKAYDKMIEAYYKIQQNIKEIMSYDVDEIKYYKKHHSSNQYKAFIAKICENIRLKNEEILSLKDFLTKGLIKNLSEQYNIKVVERNNIVEESKKQENINLNSNDMVPRLAM